MPRKLDRHVYRFPTTNRIQSGGEFTTNRATDVDEAVAKVINGFSQINYRTFSIRQSLLDDIKMYSNEFTDHNEAQLGLTLREINEVTPKFVDRCELALKRISDWNDRAENIARKAAGFLKESGFAKESETTNEHSIDRRIERALEKRAEELRHDEEELLAKTTAKRNQFEAEFAERRDALLRKYAEMYRDLEDQPLID